MSDSSENDDAWLEDFREETDDQLGDAPPGFLLDELLGRGGMAEVYLAHRTGPKGFSRKVVIKRIRPDKVNEEDFVERFIREASLTSKFHHPNIVEILELANIDNNYFIVMEYLNGKPINSLVDKLNKQGEKFPLEMASYIVSGLASALSYAHNFIDEDGRMHQIVHRDISPDNVMATYAGQVKLLDFGVAKDLDGTQMTQGDQVIGKPLYLPPESLQGAPASAARDVYSLGMTLYVMVAGRPPFDMSSGPEGLAKLLMDITGGAPAPPPSKFNPDIPEDLEHIVMKSIAREPDERYTAADFQVALDGWLSGNGFNVSQTSLAAFVRELGGVDEESTSGSPTTGKPLKALGVAKAKGGWERRETGAPTRTAPITASEFEPVRPVDTESGSTKV
ncbi:MAG: serine/threonine-protein kinase, partial [Myxococcota bacterium]